MRKILKHTKRQIRHKRIRSKVKGTDQCPRLSVFRSNKYIYLQLIDDQKSRTLAAIDDRKIKLKKVVSTATRQKDGENKDKLSSKRATAFEIGKLLAGIATEKKIKKIVFDRGGYKYHGRVKAVADGLRAGGLEF